MKVKRKKGFTLVEIVVALASFMIVMLTITSILSTVIKYSSNNNKTFNLGKISQIIFETIKEEKVDLNGKTKEDYEGGFNFTVNDENELKNSVRNNIFKAKGNFSNTESFDSCNTDSSKRYCIGVNVQWIDRGSSTSPIGVYKVEVNCWDVNKGETSLIHRVTRISID